MTMHSANLKNQLSSPSIPLRKPITELFIKTFPTRKFDAWTTPQWIIINHKFQILAAVSAVPVFGQSDYYRDSQNAAILKDSRYLSGDGTFGAAYSQEDGVEFKEESDEYGNRRGSYSYVDPTGQRRTVTYTAGVNGFQVGLDLLLKARDKPPFLERNWRNHATGFCD